VRWFKRKWYDKQEGINDLLVLVNKAYQDATHKYAFEITPPARQEQSASNAYNNLDNDKIDDEITRWTLEPCTLFDVDLLK
jgi:hypothetical protein